MNDPYKVLGVSPSSSDEQVKSAYKELVKKYHPDNYMNNPLADLASEKMKEINEAYDQVNKMRESGGGRSYSGGRRGGTSTSSGSAKYRNIRELINSGQIADAQSILDAVQLSDRDAEWHFLMGSIMYRKGWTNEAYVNFQNAYRSEPDNQEYREAVERMARQMNGGGFGGGFGGYGGGGFGGGYNSGQPGGCNGCDMCSAMLCADCLCNGMGGGGC